MRPIGNEKQGPDPCRGAPAPAGGPVVGGLRGPLLLVGLTACLALLGRADPVGLLPMSGLATAGVLFAIGRRRDRGAAGFLAASAAAAFLVGGVVAGLVLTSALAAAWIYGWPPRKVFAREDDHFFLGSLLFWGVFALVLGCWLSLGGQAGRQAVLEVVARAAREYEAALADAAKAYSAEQRTNGVLAWATAHPGSSLAAIVLPAHGLVAFVAVRWVRRRRGLVEPLRGEMICFRVGVPYSLALVVALALLVLAPYVTAVDLAGLAVPLLAWFGVGCFVAGLACGLYALATLRLARRPRAFWIALIGLGLMVFVAGEAFVMLGLIDIWFDVRRLSPKKGENIDGRDSV